MTPTSHEWTKVKSAPSLAKKQWGLPGWGAYSSPFPSFSTDHGGAASTDGNGWEDGFVYWIRNNRFISEVVQIEDTNHRKSMHNTSSQRDSIRCSLFAHAIFGWDDLCSKGGRTVELCSLSCSFARLHALLLNGGLRGCFQSTIGRERRTQRLRWVPWAITNSTTNKQRGKVNGKNHNSWSPSGK